MKIAFLIGVSEYTTQNPLPACENDAMGMANIIKDIANYDDVLVLTKQETVSENVNSKLIKFIEDYKKQSIDELFFYFSGHGLYNDNELFFILSDYQESRKRQTSLLNSELDLLFKSLNPKLIVKVIDACNAGIQYIKNTENAAIKTILETSQNQFNSCYFMFSSQKNQASYINDNNRFSDFTNSFIMSLTNREGDIRYKDITNYISDDFENNRRQTPLFINQAQLTEKFAFIDKSAIDIIKKQILNIEKQNNIVNELENKNSEPTLKDIIELDNQRYITKEHALDILNEIKSKFENYVLPIELNELYEVTCLICSSNDRTFNIEKSSEIGKWLKNNENNFFAKPTYKEETYKKMVPVKNMFSIIAGSYDEKEVIATRTVVDAFNVNFDTPLYALRLYIKPKENYQNIRPFDVTMVFLISKVDLKIFYYFATYKETSWNYYKSDDKISWQSIDFQLKNFNIEDLTGITENFERFILENLSKEFRYIDNNKIINI